MCCYDTTQTKMFLDQVTGLLYVSPPAESWFTVCKCVSKKSEVRSLGKYRYFLCVLGNISVIQAVRNCGAVLESFNREDINDTSSGTRCIEIASRAPAASHHLGCGPIIARKISPALTHTFYELALT